MTVALIRMRLPVAVTAGELRPGLAAIRYLCAAPPSSAGTSTVKATAGKSYRGGDGVSVSGAPDTASTVGIAGATVAVAAATPASYSAESSTAASSNSSVSESTRNTSKRTFASTASKWMWRGIFTAAGATVAGAAAIHVTDPDTTREFASSFRDEVDQRVRFFTEPCREKLLPDPVSPYPGVKPLRTLVINLDETLVHSSYSRKFGWRVAKRPGTEAFLAYMSSFYEIVIFTSGVNTYADPILNKLDPNRYHISYRLYRGETKYEKGVHVKDLSHLNRDLSRVVLLDNDPAHCKYHPENAILIPSWTDEPDDTALLDLIPFLEDMVHEDVPDIRTETTALQGKHLKTALEEYRANSAFKSNRLSSARGSLFGLSASSESRAHADMSSTSEPHATPSGEFLDAADDSKETASLWGQVSRSGSLFRPGKRNISAADGEAQSG